MTPEPAPIWVVDDDRSVRFVLARALAEAGYPVREFANAEAALAAIAEPPRLVFTDVRMPGIDGMQLLAELRAHMPDVPVVVMSAYTDVATTASAFRGGALDYLPKPFDLDDAVMLVSRRLGDSAPTVSAPPLQQDDAEPALLGETPVMRALYRAIGRLAQVPLSVLITGETGTGKELVARALHRESPRAARPFVAINTAAIPAELLESELFGHEAGAFTGAQRRHPGRFEQAQGGTLFLDEIGDMPAPLQTRLLRVLAEGEFYRVGGRETIRVDVRVIAATHQDLRALVAAGRFRADLLHRLDVVHLDIPPLRARRADIPMLAKHFLAVAVKQLKLKPRTLRADALSELGAHDWPGNVRELENTIRRLVVLAPGEVVTAEDVREALGKRSAHTPEDWHAALRHWADAALAAGLSDLHRQASTELERILLDAALAHCQGHRQQAAQRLGLGRNTLTRKLGASRPRRKEHR